MLTAQSPVTEMRTVPFCFPNVSEMHASLLELLLKLSHVVVFHLLFSLALHL